MRDLVVVAVVMVLITGFVFSIHGIAQGERDFHLSADIHDSIIIQEASNPLATSPLRP